MSLSGGQGFGYNYSPLTSAPVMLDVSQRVYCFCSFSMPLSAINPLIMSRRPRRKTLILSLSVPLLDFISARRLSRIAKEAHNQSPGSPDTLAGMRKAKIKSGVGDPQRCARSLRVRGENRPGRQPALQCLDVLETMHHRKARRTRLMNVYNKARVEGDGYTIDHMNMSRLILGRTILTGDLNARSPVWDPWVAGRQNADTVERFDLI